MELHNEHNALLVHRADQADALARRLARALVCCEKFCGMSCEIVAQDLALVWDCSCHPCTLYRRVQALPKD